MRHGVRCARSAAGGALCAGAWLVCASFAATPAFAADGYMGSIGGSGGNAFQDRCGPQAVLAGIELRTGNDVDAVRPLCRIATGPSSTTDQGAPGMPGPGDGVQWHGGSGGRPLTLACPPDRPVVTGMAVRAEGVDTVVVNNIHLFCGRVAPDPDTGALPAAVYDGPDAKASGGFGVGGDLPSQQQDTLRCPAGSVGVGLMGRAGSWVDGLGLVCGPPVVARVGISIGRTGGGTGGSNGADPAVCDAARDARARNSPAAAALEARCAASTATLAPAAQPTVSAGAPQATTNAATSIIIVGGKDSTTAAPLATPRLPPKRAPALVVPRP